MMRVTTLKAAGDRLGGLLTYYAGLAEDRQRSGPQRGPVEYYLDPDEPAGRWWGRGRHVLGLDGEVTGEDLRAVLEGHAPQSGRRLGRRFGDSSARGFDATFSAPKSVSVLWALTPDRWVRAEVLAAHDAAVDAALGYLERHGAVTRRGKDGVDQVDTVGLTVAVLRQHTSRTMDPQLHTHAVIAAKVQDLTGRWLSLDARFLKQQQRTIGWVYDAALRSELTSRLGVAWKVIAGGQADIDGIPTTLLGEFSRRSAQVDEALADLIGRWSVEHDGTDPDPRTIADLQRRAVLASRPGKDHGVDAATLHDEWTDRAAATGQEVDLAVDVLDRPPRTGMIDDDIVTEALRRAEEETATWLEADLARHVATLIAPDDPTAVDAVERIDRLASVAAERCVELAPPGAGPLRRDGRPVSEAVTDRRLTTAHVLDQETDLQRWAQANVGTIGGRTDPARAGARGIAGFDRFVLVVGPAGTGKTTATAAAVARLKSQGRSVVALAPSGKAADVLATEAGCEATTIASFLLAHARRPFGQWPRKTTVIVDEAGMATTDDLHRLMRLVEANGWRLVCVGDPHQLPAVGRGGTFAHWTTTLPHHHLAEPRRFTEPWEAAASLALRAGDPGAAETYADHDRLTTVHPVLLPERVARRYLRHDEVGQTIAITTTTADTARRINVAIQRATAPPRRSTVRLADGTHTGAGDTIATRHNDRTLATNKGNEVRNRHTWTVLATRRDGSLVVERPDRGTVSLPADYVSAHVELGWAVTGYGNQGDTTDIGIAVLEPATTRAQAYVALTRGRHTNTALVLDDSGSLDSADALAAVLTRTPSTESALATRERLSGRVLRPATTPQDHEAAVRQRLEQLAQGERDQPVLRR
ncbi:relaxase domain-containing protein [Iamia sp. SCSIO 61187]|uniref:MobF family relaxase n=1 Tax=Iamia sp. SCSIO 61187 TaxID=2722752 RepID=UPI001C635885|nr:MobF family relaxase [Iamia sp. SCSIO 61187]QYG93555.1 relaxase domain-containing protein [Iamia sp. SCSIO 61187]